VLPDKTFTPGDIIGVIARRRWLILLPFAAGVALVPVIAEFIPKTYRSETLITVVPQRVPDSYVKSTITATVEDRLPSISDQILSRSRLERIILDFGLYKEERARMPMEDVVQRMRGDIGSPKIEKGAQSFHVSYANPNPGVAQKVTARLAQLFVEENSNERENLAESTNVFLESQLEDAKQRLITHEQKLEAFRRSHDGELPSQLESNLRAISSAQLLLQSATESTNRAQERRLLIERQLVDAKTLPIAVVPGTIGQKDVAMSATQQLEVEQARLAQLKLRYTPDHPEMRTAERTIRDLREKAAEEAKQSSEHPAARIVSREELDRQKRIKDLEAELDVIDHQLQVNQAEEGRLKGTIAAYQRKVEAVPSRESELVELTRDYDVLKKSYDSLLARKEDSKIAVNLERRQIGEQFRVVDAASLPETASNEFKRLGFSLSGAAAGLVLGLVLVGFLEYRDSSFADEDDVTRLLNVPVLALVPAMVTDREKRKKRRRRLAVDLAGSTLLMASLAVVIVWSLGQA
jgi:polysaccharide chain length determinant protein (PEP-CTERM system associated)